jgi:hypothetical protein
MPDSNMPALQFIPVAIGEVSDFAEKTVFSTGSRGYRGVFKAVLNVGTEETPDLRRLQVQVLATEVGSKGQEDYESFKAEKEKAKAAKAIEKAKAVIEEATPIANGGSPRIATS